MSLSDVRSLIISQITDGPPNSITPSKLRQLLVDLCDVVEADEFKGVANGYAGLDGSGKVPTDQLPSSLVGGLNYQGAWNASTNSPTLTSGIGTKGYYYGVSVAGSTNLNGVTDWKIGDLATFNGTAWEKIDNTDAVTSVASRTGDVTLAKADITGLTKINVRGADIASASTVNLTNATGDYVTVTGTTAITAITLADGEERVVRFSGILTLTNGASLLLPNGGGNIATAAGDVAVFRGEASGVVRCISYQRATGQALAGAYTVASQATAEAGTDNTDLMTALRTKQQMDALGARKPVLAASVATTSGTAVDFTGIPSWATRIDVLFNGVSTNGTDNLQVQVGAGSIQTSGYESAAANDATGVAYTGGFGLTDSSVAVATLTGVLTLLLFGSNTWVGTVLARHNGSVYAVAFGAGIVTLSGALDRVRLTTTGSNTFDAGSVTIRYS